MTPAYDRDGITLYQGDVLDRLREMPDQSVHTCPTSPPYWGLRDYGVPGQLGLEPTPEEFVTKMVEIFREVRRVLRDDGTLWLNLGDTYSRDPIKGERTRQQPGIAQDTVKSGAGIASQHRTLSGLKPKDLVGIPWRVAFALQADGWWLRSDIIWHKPNPMPESVTDRPTKAHEYIFLLTKSARYYYDNEAIKENGVKEKAQKSYHNPDNDKYDCAPDERWKDQFDGRTWGSDGARNLRDVWSIATHPMPEAHFATFPRVLIEPCIKAGTSEFGCCPNCGAPCKRIVEKNGGTTGKSWNDHSDNLGKGRVVDARGRAGKGTDGSYQIKTLGWEPTCTCQAGKPVPCTVLDPFMGSGTTAVVAYHLRRRAVGIELSEKYLREICIPRIERETAQQRMF